MIINMTLVVQMVHFAIAYYLLKTIFLKEAVLKVRAHDAEEYHLQATLHNQQKQLAEHEEEKRLRWLYLHRLLQEEKPSSLESTFPYSIPSIDAWPSLVDVEQLAHIKREAEDALVKRISRD
jgi:hypothetical protein